MCEVVTQVVGPLMYSLWVLTRHKQDTRTVSVVAKPHHRFARSASGLVTGVLVDSGPDHSPGSEKKPVSFTWSSFDSVGNFCVPV